MSGLREKLRDALCAVEHSERTLAQAQRLTHSGSWTFDLVTRTAEWSAEAYRIFGLDPGQRALVGDEFLSLVYADDRERYTQLIGKAVREGVGYDAEYRIVRPSGDIRWVHALAQPAVDADGQTTLLHGTVADISERRADEEEIRQLAHFDALTGLPNRNLLFKLLGRALARTQRRGASLAVLFIDLDGFKQINDRLGHDAGDALLALFAQRLSGCLRKSDTAARVGGDEFVVVIDDFEEPASVSAIAQRILAAAAKPFQLATQECSISASIGIGMHPQAGGDVDTLVKNADRAMYCAKHAGKSTYRFWSSNQVSVDDPERACAPVERRSIDHWQLAVGAPCRAVAELVTLTDVVEGFGSTKTAGPISLAQRHKVAA